MLHEAQSRREALVRDQGSRASGYHTRVLRDKVQVQEAWLSVSGQSGNPPIAWRDAFGSVYIDGTRAPNVEAGAQPGPITEPGHAPELVEEPAGEVEAGRGVEPYPGVAAGVSRGVQMRIEDPVQAHAMVNAETQAGRGIRHLAGREYVQWVWATEYGGQGNAPVAWVDGGGRLVVNADLVEIP
jgi:hypothetical protein